MWEWLGNLIGGGSGSSAGSYDLGGGSSSGGGFSFGSFLSDLLPVAAQSGLGYLAAQGAQDSQNERLAQQQSFTMSEAEKERAFQLQLLREKLAAGGGGGGGGGGGAAAAVAKQRMLVDALAGAAQNRLNSAQLPMTAIGHMIQAIQQGLR